MGKRAEEHRGALRLSNPMEHGVVTNWEDMERLWQFFYAEENLNLPTEGQPVRVGLRLGCHCAERQLLTLLPTKLKNLRAVCMDAWNQKYFQ